MAKSKLIKKAPHADLTYTIIGAAMAIHRKLGPGYGEKIYQKDLEQEFQRRGTAFSVGLDVVDCGLLPTPVLSAKVKRESIPGVMITASHNPPEWNGFQFHEVDSHIYGPEKEEEIKSMLSSDISLPDWQKIGKPSSERDCIDDYIYLLINFVEIDKPIKVVADYGGGMASVVLPKLLKELGVELIEINSELDPFFSKRPSEPSSDAIKELRSVVVNEKADVGFAYDGDADRVMIVDERGEVVEGDKIIYLFVNENLTPPASIVVTADISMVVEKALKERGFEVVRSRWGQTFIGDTVRNSKAVFAAETNDHYMFPELSLHADGIAATAILCSILSKTESPLSFLFDELQETHVHREKVDFTEDLVKHAEKVNLFFEKNYGNFERIHQRLYVTSVDESKLLIRQSPFDRYVRIFAESYHPNKTSEMMDGVKGMLLKNRL